MNEIKTKFCFRCEQEFSLESFYKRTDATDGRQSHCKKCDDKRKLDFINTNPEYKKQRAEICKRWRDSHKDPVKAKWNHLLKTYGLTEQDYNDLLTKQNSRCAICGALESGTSFYSQLVVDHDHKSNKVRGLLCHACNVLLGKAKDNLDILQSAITYLKK